MNLAKESFNLVNSSKSTTRICGKKNAENRAENRTQLNFNCQQNPAALVVGKLPTEQLNSGQATELLKQKSFVITPFAFAPRFVLKQPKLRRLIHYFHVLVCCVAFVSTILRGVG